MNKNNPTFLIFLAILLVFFCQPATADTITLDRDELETIFTDIQLANSPWPAEDLVINDFSSTPSTLTVPLGSIDYELMSQNHDKYLGQKTISVLIKVNGVAKGKVKMRGNLELYGDVVIVSRRLNRRDIISNEDLAVVRRNITMFSHELVTSPGEAIGQGLKTSLGPGAILLKQYLEEQPLVKRGDLVTITATTPSMQITTKGEARSQGAKGDIVRVKNLSSRQMISAQVVSHGMVRVDF